MIKNIRKTRKVLLKNGFQCVDLQIGTDQYKLKLYPCNKFRTVKYLLLVIIAAIFIMAYFQFFNKKPAINNNVNNPTKQQLTASHPTKDINNIENPEKRKIEQIELPVKIVVRGTTKLTGSPS